MVCNNQFLLCKYLYGSKFRIMASWKAFISEYSTNLIYFFESSNLSLHNSDFCKEMNVSAKQMLHNKTEDNIDSKVQH